MNQELALSSEAFGFISGIFFIGYFLFEVSSNVMLNRYGARIWIVRILVTWGAVSVACGFVQSANQLYVLRFLPGVAKAGFFPGTAVRAQRARHDADARRPVDTALRAPDVQDHAGHGR